MKKKLFLSISIQISIFLVIVAFMPVAIMMALNTYEKQQLSMMENSNVQQGRLVSSALSAKDRTSVDVEFAASFMHNMNNRFDSRIRILDKDGTLLLDSAKLNLVKAEVNSTGTANEKKSVNKSDNSVSYDLYNVDEAEPEKEREKEKEGEPFLYRFYSYPIRIYRKYFLPPKAVSYDSADFYSDKTVFDGDEVKAAMAGNYGAKTRISSGGQVSVTLYSAIPIRGNDDVIGVVLVNRSTYRILQNLYELRLDLGRIMLLSVIVVILVAIFLALRISRPLRKLAKQTSECADKKGTIRFTEFTGQKRIDEIGDLSRAFSSLIERLNKRIKFSQAFSSDISHEFKNPLTAIRTLGELLENNELTSEERRELSQAIIDEVTHLQELLNGIRNISKIEAGVYEGGESIELISFTQNLIDRCKKNYAGTDIKLVVQNSFKKEETVVDSNKSNVSEIIVNLPQELLEIVIMNLVDNAASFGSKVQVLLQADIIKDKTQNILVAVEDNGPGISMEQREKIFERFYSERKENQKENHTGLGLSIVKAVTDSLEGEIRIEKSQSLGGAKFIFQTEC